MSRAALAAVIVGCLALLALACFLPYPYQPIVLIAIVGAGVLVGGALVGLCVAYLALAGYRRTRRAWAFRRRTAAATNRILRAHEADWALGDSYLTPGEDFR